jgi:hypothetical protein
MDYLAQPKHWKMDIRFGTWKLRNLYSSPDIIRQVKSRRMRWAGHAPRMGEERKLYKVLVGKPEGRRPLRRPRRRWEDGVRLDLREIGLGCVDWIRLAQDRDRRRAVVSAVMNLRVLAPRSWLLNRCYCKHYFDVRLSVVTASVHRIHFLTEDRGKILCLCRGSNPDSPVDQPVVRHYTS